MKICVLGAGVIGVSTAYALARLGHEIVVIDKEKTVAAGASHANGAQLSYSYVDPFASPRTLAKLPGYMLGLDPAIKLGLTMSPSYFAWGLRFLKNCTSKQAASNLRSMLEISHHSYKAMARLQSDLSKPSVSQLGAGKLVLARNKREYDLLASTLNAKREAGFEVEMMTRQQSLDLEPSLAHWRGEFVGGVYAAQDKVLDPVMLCRTVQTACENRFGVIFLMGHNILALSRQDDQISHIQTDRGDIACDAAVMCLGNDVSPILQSVGLNSNIYPMRGYSLTLPAGENAPSVSITDPSRKIVFANLGKQIRIAGFLDANLPARKIERRGGQMLDTAQKLWPGAADYAANANFWTGMRPMTPSGIPVVGQSPVKGLFYNMGHGSLGLTLAAGSAERLADIIGTPLRNSKLIGGTANDA